MDKIYKFLEKLSKKQRMLILSIFEDLKILNLANYDVKALKGKPGMFRLRQGSIRVIFAKMNGKGIVIAVGFRKDIYEKI